jgi:hypothetical protein
MTLPPLKGIPPHNASDPHTKARFVVSHVRMTITQKEGVQTLAVPATVHKMLTSIRAVDNKTVFTNVQKKPFTLENFPSDKATFDTAFGTIIKDGCSTKVIIGFMLWQTKTGDHAGSPAVQHLHAPPPKHIMDSLGRHHYRPPTPDSSYLRRR